MTNNRWLFLAFVASAWLIAVLLLTGCLPTRHVLSDAVFGVTVGVPLFLIGWLVELAFGKRLRQREERQAAELLRARGWVLVEPETTVGNP